MNNQIIFSVNGKYFDRNTDWVATENQDVIHESAKQLLPYMSNYDYKIQVSINRIQ
jgi:hypothetical protein